MYFKDVIGHTDLKSHLRKTVDDQHIGHSIMLAGSEGAGKLPLALAYVGYLFCENRKAEDRCGNCPACKKMDVLGHPDLHFSFPFIISTKIKTSRTYQRDFIDSILKNPYLSLSQWEDTISDTNKKSIITADESQDIIRRLSLKSFDGGYKVMVIWRADRLNPTAQNKLLKTLEEPDPKTLILLIVNNPEDLLPTINSRAQLVKLKRLPDETIAEGLVSRFEMGREAADKIARIVDGDFAKAIHLAKVDGGESPYFQLFLQWTRSSATGNLLALKETCTALTAFTREQQQAFLEFGLQFVHQTIMYNYLGEEAARFSDEMGEDSAKFAKFIGDKDLNRVHDILSKGHYLVQRNIHPHLLFMKMGIDLMTVFKIRNQTQV